MDLNRKEKCNPTLAQKYIPCGPGLPRRFVSFIWRVIGYNPYIYILDGIPYWSKTKIDLLWLLNSSQYEVDFFYNGLKFKGPVNSLYLIPELAVNGYTEFIHDCKRVLDLGGYIGESALALSQYNNEVWVYEPEPTKHTLLKRNIDINNRSDLIKSFCFAVIADERDTLFINSNGDLDGSASLSDSGDIKIACISIEKVLSQAEFDGLKMDIEGGEYEIFQYFFDSPKQFKFKCGVIEIHLPKHENEDTAILDKFLLFLKEKALNPAFYQRPSKLLFFENFSEIRKSVNSDWIMLKFGQVPGNTLTTNSHE